MKISFKAALLSGLVFPGVGQIILKHYKRGIVLIGTTGVSLIIVVVKAVQQALIILDKTEMQGGPVNLNTISKAATKASTTFGNIIMKVFLFIMVVCWVIGVVDAYRLGRKK